MSVVATVAATAPLVAVAAGAALGEPLASVQGLGVVLVVTRIVLTAAANCVVEQATVAKPMLRARHARPRP